MEIPNVPTPPVPPAEPTTPQGTQVIEPTVPPVPEKYKGKSAEELVRLLEETESEGTRRSKQISDLRADLEYSESLRQRRAEQIQDQQVFSPGLPPKEPQFAWDYEKPVESTVTIAESIWQRREAERQSREAQTKAYEAQAFFAEGKRQAEKSNPRIFEGIEKEVDQVVYDSYRAGIIPLYELRNPETRVRAAQLIHLRDGKYDRLRPTIEPMKATATETPTSARVKEGGQTVSLDTSEREVQDLMEQSGLTQKEAEEIVKSELELMEKGGIKEIVRRAKR